MKAVSLILALTVIASLDVILLWGAVTAGKVVGSNVTFGIVVLVMDFSLIGSSLLLGYLFCRAHRAAWAGFFFANLLIMLAGVVLKLSGTAISSLVLFAVDVYWLNLYLACLASEWRWFTIAPAHAHGARKATSPT